ncbi:hypothetical protein F5884DRAFT_785557 [Xylogone sp. PMI_703]|nr:hypothetical protein F5884DRAFT_785557 [Xylogone sp. PMI_703]
MSAQGIEMPPYGGFNDLPLTEEQRAHSVLRVENDIRKLKEGSLRDVEPWIAYPLDRKGYQDLLDSLERDHSLRDYVRYKLRYDYFPSSNRFILRMPIAVHEMVKINIIEELQRQLRSIAEGDNQSAEFARALSLRGSTTIKFKDPEYGEHSPDSQFQHAKERYPGVVIEVSYASKRKDLYRLADDYILGSDGDIQVVVGIDVEYRGSKKATLSIWRPRVVKVDDGELELVAAQTVKDVIFRNEDGAPNLSPEAGLSLELKVFASEDLTESYGSLSDPIRIPADALWRCLRRLRSKHIWMRMKVL